MIWFAFASALASSLTLQTRYGHLEATPEIYQPPAVRPFEPASNFGREEAEGDADETLHRRTLSRPVVVDAYVGSYETSPTDVELAYDQGVSQAEIDMDRRAGPLDGKWRVLDADGTPILSLALTDLGGGRLVEGAWRRLTPRAAGQDSGFAGPVQTDGKSVVVPAAGGELRLHAVAGGWSGVLLQDGRRRAVTLARAG